MAENTELLSEIKQVTEKLREVNETQGKNSADFKNLTEKSEKLFEDFEKMNKEANEKFAAAEQEKADLEERIKQLEIIGSAGASGNITAEEMKEDSKAVMNAMLKSAKGTGVWLDFISDERNQQKAARVMGVIAKTAYHDTNEAGAMDQLVKAYGQKASGDLLRSDIGELGGFLCPPEWSAELNKNIIEYAPLRSFARVKRTSSKTYKEPIRIGIPSATRPGESRAGGTSNPNYSMNDFSPVRLTNTSAVTWDELQFNNYDLAGELMRDNAEAFAVKEGQEFFNGSGVEQGVGWTVDDNVPEYITAAAGVADFDDFIGITGELKRGYNPLFMFNRRTLAQLRLLKDSSGRYLWNPAFGDAAGGAPATINGVRYSADFIEFDDLDAGAGKFPVLLADMMRFYQIVDRTDMTIIRDEYTQKKEGIVEYTWNKWCVGKPKIHEAGIRMKVKA